MEFLDTCIDIKIKSFREVTSNSFFNKSFIVKPKQEYKIKIVFHSFILTEFRRYSQFRELKKKVNSNQLSPEILESLPPFPKKKFLKSSPALNEIRRQLLEKWIQSLLLDRSHHISLFNFLNVSESFIRVLSSCSGCKLTPVEKIVSNLIRDFSKKENKRSKYLKRFDYDFFELKEACLGQFARTALLNLLVPLCSSPSLGYLAVDILYRMLRIESYRFAGEIMESLFRNLELLQKMEIEKHILNKHSQETGQQGYFIAKLMKEYFDRNGMFQYFKYALNFNEEAFEKFCVKVEGKAVNESVCRLSSTFGKTGEWIWLNTDNYPGGLKIGFRKIENFIEVKSEMFVKSNVKVLSSFILSPDKRKKWDMFVKDIKVIKHDKHSALVLYEIKTRKNTNKVQLFLEFRKTEKLGKVFITYRSNEDSEENNTDPKFLLSECYYEVSKQDLKVRRSSSTTDEISENEENDKIYARKSSSVRIEENYSRLSFYAKFKPEMARLFVSDFSEETSGLKESFVNLKRTAEERF